MVEHGPQAVGARERRAGIFLPPLMECDTRRRDVWERARRVVAEARLFDERLRRPCASPCLAPGSFLGREERELRLRQVDLFHAAGGEPPVDGCEKVRHCTIGRAEQGVRNSSAEECRGDPKTVRRELIQRQVGVGERLLDTVRHHVRAQRGDPRLDGGAAVRERDLRGCPVGEVEPALSFLGSPRQRTPPGSKDCEPGVLHELVVTEPPEPLLKGLQAAVVVERRS